MYIPHLAVIGLLLVSSIPHAAGSDAAATPREDARPSVPARARMTLQALGDATRQDLEQRYNDTAAMCTPQAPEAAVACSGVLLRGTQHSSQYHAWNPNPAPTTTGQSFSYLRRDASYASMYIYRNGFIFHPASSAPADKDAMEILCFFPRDGATNIRDDQGCGQAPDAPHSRPCQDQGIITAAQWAAHYQQYGSYGDMCGFDIRRTRGADAAAAFAQGLLAQALIFDPAINEYNEIRVAKWEQDIGQRLPIQAFFYLDDTDGKAAARYDQLDFLEQTGIAVPIIRITLPAQPGEQAVFQFIAGDQAIDLAETVD